MEQSCSVQQARLIQAAAQNLNLPVAALQDELRHLVRRQRRPLHEEETEEGPVANAAPSAFEVALCEHLVHADEHPGVAELVERYLPLTMLQDTRCRAVAEAALKAVQEQAPVQDLLRGSETQIEGLEAFAAGLLVSGPKVQSEEVSPAMAVQDLVLRLWQRHLMAERDSIQRGVRQTAEDMQRMSQITLDLNSLKQWGTGMDVIEIEQTD